MKFQFFSRLAICSLTVFPTLNAEAGDKKQKPLCESPITFEPTDAALAKERSTDARDGGHAALANRMAAVMAGLAQMELKKVRTKHSDTYAYGHGANTLKAGAYRRPFHAKAHGCVVALFKPTVDLSKHEGVGGDAGIFNPTKSEYQAVIRFSNAKGEMLADTEDDLKGFAMRVFDVEGPRLRSTLTGHQDPNERPAQDFLLTNAPVHFAKDAEEMVRFAEFILKPGSVILDLVNPFGWGRFTEKLGNAFKAVGDIKKQRTDSVLKSNYYSRAPFAVGKKAAKFWVSPAPCDWSPEKSGAPFQLQNPDHPLSSQSPMEKTPWTSPHHYREELIAQLSKADFCFDFNVQFQVDPNRQCIEEANVEWKEEEAPSIRVARIRIPQQEFATRENDTACEDLGFNPWNGLAAHLPLGNMNRARETVYYEIQRLRLHGGR